MYRFLFTGSREWEDKSVVKNLLTGFLPIRYETILVEGAAPGLDQMVCDIALELGWPEHLIEEHPWKLYGSPRARNQHMVDLGADVCFAFAMDGRSGTGMCARMARKAGIPVLDFGVDTK